MNHAIGDADMNAIRLTIKAAEGGLDARLFADELAESYLRLCARKR